MQIVHTILELRQILAAYQKPAFVPTMGNLHDGHLDLIKLAKQRGDVSVASIFVNRLQFLPHEDFATYPRTWDADCARLPVAICCSPPARKNSTPSRRPSKCILRPIWPTSWKGTFALASLLA